MLRSGLRLVNLTHISLALAGLMWVLPFLYYDHPLPIPAFYAEWLAALLGLCAMFLLATPRFWQPLRIPRIALLPAALALLVMVQYSFGMGNYVEQSFMSALYLLWAALLIVLGRHLRDELSLPALATALALFLLVGAELSALIGVMQHYSWHKVLGMTVVMEKNFAEVSGNLAQPNHLANYLALGLVSLGLLYFRWKLRVWQLLLLALPLLFVMVLSASRSSWLYLACVAGMAFLWQRRDKSSRPLLKYTLLLLLGFGLMHWVVKTPWLTGTHGNVTAAQRMVEAAGAADSAVAGSTGDGAASGGTQGSIRQSLWREAWLVFIRNPLMGAGFDQFEWQHFRLGPELRDSTLSNLNNYVEHAHNLVLHLAAETGLAGLLMLFGMLALWLAQAYRAPRTVYHWWGYAVLAVLAIHSMLEYPLWYTFFLGAAAVVLGMLDDTSHTLAFREKLAAAGRWATFAVLLAGMLLLSQMLRDYRRLEDLQAATQQVGAVGEGNIRRARDELAAMRGHATLLRPYIESLLGEAQWDHIADQRALNERVMRFAPTREVVQREVLLLARDGLQDEARIQVERVIWIYPGDFPLFLNQLERLAELDKDPSRFPALLDFAQQKYKEWQRATRNGHAD